MKELIGQEKTRFEDLNLSEQAEYILKERTPHKEEIVYPLTIEYLDPQNQLTREERGKVIAMGDRTAKSYRTLTKIILDGRGKVDTGEFYLMYALAAKSSNEISHTSILEQVNPGPSALSGDSSIIFEGVSILSGLRDICSLRHFGFEAFSSRGGVFPENYWRIPPQIEDKKTIASIEGNMKEIYGRYIDLTKKAIGYYLGKTKPMEGEKASSYRWRVLNFALDDARQVTNQIFLNHFSMHPNSALSLRDAVVKLSSSELPENRNIADILRNIGKEGLPTLMEFTEPSSFNEKTFDKKDKLTKKIFNDHHKWEEQWEERTCLTDFEVTPEADKVFLASFLSNRGQVCYEQAFEKVKNLEPEQISSALDEIFAGITLHDKPPEELEMIQITAHTNLTVGAIYELIRHRLATHLVSRFRYGWGVTIPQSFIDMGLEKEYCDAINLSKDCYGAVSALGPKYEKVLGPYFVTRANIIPTTMRLSGLDAFHFLKLRASNSAHPDISGPAYQLENALKKDPGSKGIFSHLVKKI